MQDTTVILGTGGTIAGAAADPRDVVGYRAGEIGVASLIAAVPPLAGLPIEHEQVAQVDSKDMSFALWLRLAQRVAAHLARPDVCGIVITHGTDTLEETAYFLQRVLAPAKPVVLTAAMRPATALSADGPQNLLDAVTLARDPDARGVLVVLAGSVWSGLDVRKQHTLRPDAFDAGDAGPLARIDAGRVRRLRAWPAGEPLGVAALPSDMDRWPWVAVVANHVSADGREVRALVSAGVQGLVVAGTGNGTLSAPLQAALRQAQGAGVSIWLTTRCAAGPVVAGDAAQPLPIAPTASPWGARVELLLHLMAGHVAGTASVPE